MAEQDAREELQNLIKERASAYVPEWRFDEENPDIGTALALVYKDMMHSVQMRYAQIMEKKQIDFLNAIGARQMPPTKAKGYVSFGLVNEKAPAVEVPAGTYVTAESEISENGTISYETKDDILVSPAKLTCLYEVNDKADYIGTCFEGEKAECNTVLFQRSEPNQQEHVLYIGQDRVFDIDCAAWFTIAFLNQGGYVVQEDIVKRLLSSEIAEITYFSEEGFVPFQKQVMEQGKLLLYKGEKQLATKRTEINGEESYWIRIQVKQMEPVQFLSFSKLQLTVSTEGKAPDFVLADGLEADLHRYLPFGERLSIYNEVYFASDKLFSKCGAEIELAFFLSFVAIPLDTNAEEKEISWKWVMEESDFLLQREYDITIASVIWEYYNGSGWTRLYEDHSQESVFEAREELHGRYVKLTFTCPEDCKKVFVNASEVYAIRARITKLNNPYKLNGNYIAPVIENTTISCDYSSHPVQKACVLMKNNLEIRRWNGETCKPFIQMGTAVESLYFGFQVPPKGAPLKIYLRFREILRRMDRNLKWEFFDGVEFQNLRVIDETADFSKSGLLTFAGPKEMEEGCFFGRKLYWIRVLDYRDYYGMGELRTSTPCLQDFIFNTVKIENLEAEQTEYFQMEYYVKHKRFRLKKKNIQKIHVFVLEAVIGSLENDWKEWTRVEHFLESSEQARHYVLDENEGYLLFGDGAAGMIPPASRQDNIKVVYQCGGGSYTNVAKGKVSKLTKTIGFINSVRNAEPLFGGMDMETREHAIKRCSNEIRVQNRAVIARDYESLAYESSRRIQKVRCFSGKDEEGKKVHGAVTLVILLKDYQSGSTQFQGVRATVQEYLKEKMPDNIYYAGKLFITEPLFILFQVKVELKVRDFNQVFMVQKKVEEMLQQFFDPIHGNFDQGGWEVGDLPNAIQIRNSIHGIEQVDNIASLFVTTYRFGSSGLEEVELEDVKRCPFVLPVSGEHEVTIQF